MNSDLKTGIMQLTNYINDQEEVPYGTHNAMIAEVSYGGRVTDKMDKFCNMAIISQYLCPEVMDNDYKFDPAGVYYSPPQDDAGTGTLQDVRDYIDSLPVDEMPGAFGMHTNADITLQQQLTKGVIDTIVEMSAAKEAEKNMPPAFDVRKGHKLTFCKALKED